MNKDVIYIEPENDITDIIDKVKTSKSALVALVPPKKSTVLGSAVNFKLLARASKAANKQLVLVTSETAILKLAALAEIPVAKNLQTRPEVPITLSDKNPSPAKVVETSDLPDEDEDKDKDEEPEEEPITISIPVKAAEDIEIIETKEEASEEESQDEEDPKKDEKSEDSEKPAKKTKSKKKSTIPSLERYRKWIILGVVGVILIAGFLVWALAFAPAVKITVSLRTTGDNFSSAISFVTDSKKEVISDGAFALETAEVIKKSSADFAATGEANKGDKSSGTVTVSYLFTATALIPISVTPGTTFSRGGLDYKSTTTTTLSYDPAACDDDSPNLTCRITVKVPVSATDPGEKYDTTESSGWSSSNTLITISASDISGGTDKIVKIVSQKDFEDAKKLISSANEADGRTELLKKFPASTFPIDGSLKVDSKAPVSSIKVGSEAPEGVTPTITSETVFSMYGVDRGKISEFIESRVAPTVPKGQKIYSTGVSSDPEQNKARIENYKNEDGEITAKLTSYGVQTGPDISEAELLEKARGRKIGEVRTLLKPFLGGNGDITIEPSVFWVSTVPDDLSKVNLIIEIEQ